MPEELADYLLQLPRDNSPAETDLIVTGKLNPSGAIKLLTTHVGLLPSSNKTGGSFFHQTSVTLNNSQILALPSSPFAVVPETETLNYVGKITKLPIIIQGALHWDIWEGTPYGNINVPDFGIFIGNDALGVGPVSYVTDIVSFFNGGFFPLHSFGAGALGGGGIGPVLIHTDQWSMDGSNHDNGLYLGIQFNGGNLTGGHATNQLRVSLIYTIYNLKTGLFE